MRIAYKGSSFKPSRSGIGFKNLNSKSLKLPALLNNRAMMIGDSRLSNGGPGNGTSRYYTGNGPACFMMDGSGPTFDLQGVNQRAVGGSSSAEALTKFDADLLADDAGTVIILTGANDAAKGMTGQQSATAIRSLCDKAGLAGRRVLLIPTYPKSTGITNQASSDGYYALYEDQKNNVHPTRAWVKIADPWPHLVDTNSALRAPQTIYLPDGLHAEHEGNRVIWEQAIRPALINDWNTLPDFAPLWQTSDGLYNVSTNIYGSMSPNPSLAGTTGTLTPFTTAGGTVSGSFATGFTLIAANMTGITGVFSKGVDSDGYTTQIIQISGTSGVSAPSLALSTSVSGVLAGYRVGITSRIKLNAGHTGVRQVFSMLNIGGTGNALMRSFSNQGPAQVLSTTLSRGFDRKHVSPHLILPINPTFATTEPLRIDFLSSSTISMTLAISRPSVRRYPV